MATGPAVAANAKWTMELHTLFCELCNEEVIKGNKVGGTLSKEAWQTIRKEFVRQKNVTWTVKQFKNHWDSMKPDYYLFRKLRFGESGLGWNEVTKTIEASSAWWAQKLEENVKYAKFRDRNLTLYMLYYDRLFGDSVATGERAKAATHYSAVDLEVGEEFTELVAEEDDGKEGSGDSDDNNIEGPCNLFPSSSFKSSKSSGSKRKKSGAEFVREGLDGLIAAMSTRSTQTTAATDDASLCAAVDILDSMEQVACPSDLYFYARRYLLDKGNRTLFLKSRNNELRFQELLYNFTRSGNAGHGGI